MNEYVPFLGLGILGSGWHRQNCVAASFADWGLVGLPGPERSLFADSTLMCAGVFWRDEGAVKLADNGPICGSLLFTAESCIWDKAAEQLSGSLDRCASPAANDVSCRGIA